ncbi:MAG: hypothetical protein IAE94_15035 [Chthoniobacterales bacterium]|nr:hypothetical protein [Chthoniobacterales bacterium]
MKRIVCFGDSITAASGAHEGGRWTGRLQRQLDDRMGDGWQVYNRGIGGNTTWQALDRFDTDVKPLLPAYVLIEYGFNDGSVPEGRRIPRCGLPAFRENLAEIVRMVRAGKGRPILVVNHPITDTKTGQGNGRTYLRNFSPYQPAIRDVAKTTKTPAIDLERDMTKAKVNLKYLLAEDGLHLSPLGQGIYADFIFSGLCRIIQR